MKIRLEKVFLIQDFWINALALVISSIPYGMFIEIGIWHWPFIQSFWSRIGGVQADLALGGLYGIWRSAVLKKMEAGKDRHWLWNWFAGSMAFTSFQIIIYLAIIFTTWLWIPPDKRATSGQILGASITIIITSPVGDKLFEWCVKFLRWWFRIQNRAIKDNHET